MKKLAITFALACSIGLTLAGCSSASSAADPCVGGAAILVEYRAALSEALADDTAVPSQATDEAREKLATLKEIANSAENGEALAAVVEAELLIIEVTERINNDDWPGTDSIDAAKEASVAATDGYVLACG